MKTHIIFGILLLTTLFSLHYASADSTQYSSYNIYFSNSTFHAVEKTTGNVSNDTDLFHLINVLLTNTPNGRTSIYVDVGTQHNMPTANLPITINGFYKTIEFSDDTLLYLQNGYSGDVFLVTDTPNGWGTGVDYVKGGKFYEDGVPQYLWTGIHLKSTNPNKGVFFGTYRDITFAYPKDAILIEVGGQSNGTLVPYVNNNLFENLEISSPYSSMIHYQSFPDWVNGNSYNLNDLVTGPNSYQYRCILPISNDVLIPSNDPSHWVLLPNSVIDSNVFRDIKGQNQSPNPAQAIRDQYGSNNQYYSVTFYDMTSGQKGINIKNSATNTVIIGGNILARGGSYGSSPNVGIINSNSISPILQINRILEDPYGYGHFVDSSDTSKQIAFSLSGMTTGKQLTLSTSQTTSQTLSIPNIPNSAIIGLATAFNFTSDSQALPTNHQCVTYFNTSNSTFREICNFNGQIHVLAKG